MNGVAPSAGAWIEIDRKVSNYCHYSVAPSAGAWIEIPKKRDILIPERKSLPPRERGLKSLYLYTQILQYLSLPPRERGLKFKNEKYIGIYE